MDALVDLGSPCCVNLDGTLVRLDVLFESIFELISLLCVATNGVAI